LATLGHELRNPLAPIRTAIGLLRTRGVADPLIVRCRDVIDRQVTQMARLLDDLLDIARLSRGKLRLQCSRVLLDTVLDAAVETSLPLIEQRRQKLSVQRSEQSIVLDADAARLTQVFGNLLNNAAKYSAESAEIWLSIELDDETVVIRVRDTGYGNAPEMLSKVFELFTQATARRVHDPGGLGIGLSLAQPLVELHGGTIPRVTVVTTTR
jgi:signal transduction histidine kinase